MTVLLTGATGFVGSALLRRLRTVGFDRENRVVCLSSRPIPGWECVDHRGWRFSADEITAGVMGEIDVVVHCGAATPHEPEDFLPDRAGMFAANVRNTCWLLDNLPSMPRKLVYISTTDVYGKVDGPIDESTPTVPASMYGASKLMCESYLRLRSGDDGFALDILRLGPIYGEGEETYSKIVSTFVAKIASGEEVLLRGTGDETRSLLHVDDCCSCIVRSICASEELPVVNVASGAPVTVRQLLHMIASELGSVPRIVESGGPRGRSDVFDNSLARRLFGSYERPIAEGLRAYVGYFRDGRRHACV